MLSNEEGVLGRRREYFKELSNPVTITPLDRPEIYVVEENTITAADTLAVKTLKDGKYAYCDEV